MLPHYCQNAIAPSKTTKIHYNPRHISPNYIASVGRSRFSCVFFEFAVSNALLPAISAPEPHSFDPTTHLQTNSLINPHPRPSFPHAPAKTQPHPSPLVNRPRNEHHHRHAGLHLAATLNGTPPVNFHPNNLCPAIAPPAAPTNSIVLHPSHVLLLCNHFQPAAYLLAARPLPRPLQLL